MVGPPKAEPALTTSMATALASDDFKGVDNNMIFTSYHYGPQQNDEAAPRWQATRLEEKYSLDSIENTFCRDHMVAGDTT